MPVREIAATRYLLGIHPWLRAKGWLDVRYVNRDGAACAYFSWEGHNDADTTC